MIRHLCVAGVVLLLATSAQAETGITKDEILVGATTGITGVVAAPCTAVANGSLAYFKKINDQGGINGRKIKYELLDDAYSAPRAIGNVRRLTQQDNVFAIFGGCGTVTAASTVSAVEKEDVPYLFPYAALNQLIEPVKKNVFALMPFYQAQLATVLPYAIDRVKAKTAAVLTPKIAGSDEIMSTVKAALAKAGVEVVDEELMDATSPERAPYLLKVRDKNPDIIVMHDSAPGASRFVIEMSRQNWKPKLIVSTTAMTDEGFLRATAHVADGIVLAGGVVLPPTAPEAKECVDDLAAYDKSATPGHFSMYGCLAAHVFVEALRRAGPDLTRATLIAALESMKDYDTGISGKVTFSSNNHMGITSVIPFTIENEQFKILSGPVGVAK